MGKGRMQAPNAPDMSSQINSGNTNAATATSDANQTFNTAKAYNANAQNTLSGVTSQQSPMMNTVNQTATNNLNSYGSTFVPLQQTQAQQAQDYGSQANVQRLQGQAIANSNAANQASRQNSAAALASEGVDPGSVHGAALDRQASVAGAAQNAQAGTQSAIQTQQTAYGMENQANQVGLAAGQLGTSQAATGSGIGSQIVSNTNQTNATGVNNMMGAAPYLNASTSANNGVTNAQNAQFGTQLQSEQANAANSGSAYKGMYAGMLGDIFMEHGGPVPSNVQMNHGIPTHKPEFISAIPMGSMPSHSPHAQSMQNGGTVSSKGALPQSPIPGSTDTVHAMLTPDEFVIPKPAAVFKGHEYWHKQVDKAMQDLHARKNGAIPTQQSTGAH